MFSEASLPTGADYALVVVYRQLVPPLAYKSTVSVNGVEALEMPNEGFSWIKVKPGHVSVKNDWSFAAGLPAGAVDMEVKAGGRYYLEITGDTGMPASELGLAIHLASNFATYHAAVQGRGFEPREESTAVTVLTQCCRYVPVEDDYVPPNPLPPMEDPSGDIPATDVGP